MSIIVKNIKLDYETPNLAITLLEEKDVIATSGNQGSLGWDTDGNVDGGGWT